MKSKAASTRRRLKNLSGSEPKPKRATAEETARILHELKVHQTELEAQNEELRHTRGELESLLLRYTELYDFAPLGYVTLAADGTIEQINLAAAKLLGYERARLIGRRFSQFLSNSHQYGFGGFFSEVLLCVGQGSKACEVALQGEEGGPCYVRLTATALLKGRAIEILMSIEDITERKRAEEERLEAELRKNRFLSLLSHGLRGPIAPISTSLAVLERTAPGGERARQALAIIGRQVTHLTRLVDDLLDIGRIERGQLQLQRSQIELGGSVQKILEDHRVSLEEQGIQLEGRLKPGPFWINADPTRIAQILTNLLNNAAKFTPRGGKVEVLVETRDQKVALIVRDNGIGIEPKILRYLFEPFVQATSSLDRPNGGLGLGLSMVKALTELHGGSVTAVSGGVGRGAEITVLLPLVAAEMEAFPAVKPLSQRCFKALIIEDNKDTADSIKMAIELLGHEVRVAYDSKSGLALTKEFRPEIVLCDIGLPGMDGYTLAKSIRADLDSRAYLVALSGYALPSDVQRAIDAGFNQHIAKPISADRLAQLFGLQTLS